MTFEKTGGYKAPTREKKILEVQQLMIKKFNLKRIDSRLAAEHEKLDPAEKRKRDMAYLRFRLRNLTAGLDDFWRLTKDELKDENEIIRVSVERTFSSTDEKWEEDDYWFETVEDYPAEQRGYIAITLNDRGEIEISYKILGDSSLPEKEGEQIRSYKDDLIEPIIERLQRAC